MPSDRSTDGFPSAQHLSPAASWQRLAWTLSAKGLKGLGAVLGNPMLMSHPTPPAMAQLTAGLLFPGPVFQFQVEAGLPL